MSGFYHILFGYNHLVGPLLDALKIDPDSVGRFRDCFLNIDGTEIIIYTRTGGNNRDAYAATIEMLQNHPRYLRDEDDSFDCTYSLFHFSIPEDVADVCKKLGSLGHGVDPAKRWKDTIDALGDRR